MIHYKSIHRAYLSPEGHQNRPQWGFFVQMTPLAHLITWFRTAQRTKVFGKMFLLFSPLCWEDWLLYHRTYYSSTTSVLELNIQGRHLHAGLTAAKRVVVRCWKPPHLQLIKESVLSCRAIAQLELSCARLKASEPQNFTCWAELLENIRNFLETAWITGSYVILLLHFCFSWLYKSSLNMVENMSTLPVIYPHSDTVCTVHLWYSNTYISIYKYYNISLKLYRLTFPLSLEIRF